jgi:hypothetical protein
VVCVARLGARPENAGKMVLVIVPSLGKRYLSSPFLQI